MLNGIKIVIGSTKSTKEHTLTGRGSVCATPEMSPAGPTSSWPLWPPGSPLSFRWPSTSGWGWTVWIDRRCRRSWGSRRCAWWNQRSTQCTRLLKEIWQFLKLNKSNTNGALQICLKFQGFVEFMNTTTKSGFFTDLAASKTTKYPKPWV